VAAADPEAPEPVVADAAAAGAAAGAVPEDAAGTGDLGANCNGGIDEFCSADAGIFAGTSIQCAQPKKARLTTSNSKTANRTG
jgi:hypothetical protein